MAAIEQAVHVSANLDDPLLHARTELLAAYVRLTFDTWRDEGLGDLCVCQRDDPPLERCRPARV